MKKYKPTILLIVISFLSVNMIGQSKGYYYNNEYITLVPDSFSIVLFFNPNFVHLNDSVTFISDTTIVSMDVSDGNEDTLFARITYRHKINNILEYIGSTYSINDSAVHDISYGFKDSYNSSTFPIPEIIFKFKSGKSIDDLEEILSRNDASLMTEKYGVYRFGLKRIDSAFSLSKKLYDADIVEWAEPNFYSSFHFNDTKYPEQFYLNNTGQNIDGTNGTIDIDIDADRAWNSFRSGIGIKVAVIDLHGVESHEDLEDDSNPNPFTSPRLDPGFTPNCSYHCLGFPKGNSGRNHGTACAGIIGASHNSIGIRGIAPGVTIIPFRIAKKNESIKSDGDIAQAINKAWDDFGADVLSCSWGGVEAPVNVITNAITLGRNGKGSIVVFSSGNNQATQGQPDFPGNLPQVISVGAVDLNGTIFSYSGAGPNVDVVAPSGGGPPGNIRTLDRMGGHGDNSGNYVDNFDGTSASCPQVAGIAALLLSTEPLLTEAQVVCRIQTTATDKGSFGFDNSFGYGIANAYYATALAFMRIEDETITGYQTYASDLIRVGPSTTLVSGSNVELVAGPGSYIKFEAGVKKVSGSKLHAYISSSGFCDYGPLRPANNMNDTNNTQYQIKQVLTTQKKEAIEIIDFDFKIIPNPNTGNFKITYTHGQKAPTSITIVDVLGNLLYENNLPDIYEMNFNFGTVTNGIYIIKVKFQGKEYFKKLIKN